MISIPLPPFADETNGGSMLLITPSVTDVGQIPVDLWSGHYDEQKEKHVCEIGIRNGKVFFDVDDVQLYIENENVLAIVSCLLNKLYALRGVKESDFKQRVELEWKALNENLTKLTAFISLPAFVGLPVNEQVRLKEQQLFMHGYADVLRHRMNNDFK